MNCFSNLTDFIFTTVQEKASLVWCTTCRQDPHEHWVLRLLSQTVRHKGPSLSYRKRLGEFLDVVCTYV